MKIWIKVILAGVILFFVGVFYITAMGGMKIAPEGMIISVVGGILIAVGALTGLTRGFNRMMNE